MKTENKKRGRPATKTRADGMTQISISLATKLVEQIDKMAEAENRNRSNFIANTLQNLANNN